MFIPNVSDVRQFFLDELKDEAYTIDRNGNKTIEMMGASFLATEDAIFGTPNEEYIEKELLWYESGSTNIFDLDPDPPHAWRMTADPHGNINSNYGHLIFSPKWNFQYSNCLNELIQNPNSRRATMIYTRPTIWLDYCENGKSDFICTNSVTYYIRDGLLQSVVQMRSNDVIFGYKNDYAWQQTVMDRMIEALTSFDIKVEKGMMWWQVQNLHVYERHFDLVK